MKSVLISIRPQWCEKIASGQKTIEVRKTAPQEVPFKCYIYESRNGGHRCKHCNEKDSCYSYAPKNVGCYNGRGKVIGWFICDKVICSQAYFDSQGKNHLTNVFPEDIKKTCLTEYDLWDYIAGKACKANEIYDGYLWHISDLKIYDKPKELSEFYTNKKCNSCKKSGYESTACMYDEDCKVPMSITRAPQSWQYIEDLGEEE